MKILNLYAGIGGNRKNWGNEHDITAIENDKETAEVYKDYFQNDIIIITDAHDFLLKHYTEFDFIWSSPPCPSHSKINTFAIPQGSRELDYSDMKLYQEIILLKHWFKGKYCIENVIGYYKPLIEPQIFYRHYFWTNFIIESYTIKNPKKVHKESELPYLQEYFGYDLTKYKLDNKRQNLRNCVLPEIGDHILKCGIGKSKREKSNQGLLFND